MDNRSLVGLLIAVALGGGVGYALGKGKGAAIGAAVSGAGTLVLNSSPVRRAIASASGNTNGVGFGLISVQVAGTRV